MSNWFKSYKTSPISRLRLFCFPYAGGSAQVFSQWADQLPDFVDVIAIQSPGRGRRFSESPIDCLKTKVQTLHREILPYTDKPYLFIGHSNGALLAYELARELQKSGNSNLKHIVLSAKRAPHLPNIKDPIHDLPNKEFIAELKGYNFTPDEVLENDELMELFLPMLRADFKLSDTHQFNHDCSLEASASLFWGKQDEDVPLNDVLAWKEVISGETSLVEFDDGHFFITSQETRFLNEIKQLIKKVI